MRIRDAKRKTLYCPEPGRYGASFGTDRQGDWTDAERNRKPASLIIVPEEKIGGTVKCLRFFYTICGTGRTTAKIQKNF